MQKFFVIKYYYLNVEVFLKKREMSKVKRRFFYLLGFIGVVEDVYVEIIVLKNWIVFWVIC